MSNRAAGIATVFVSCLAQLIISVDMTVLHLAVPALTTQLDASGEEVLWVADIYGFTMGGLLVIMGNLGDRYGRRRMLVLGALAFAASSALAAYASSPELLILARALLGVAGSAMMPSTTSLLRAVFTTQRGRALAVGANAGVSSAGFALGPIVGGLLLDSYWWGSVFLVNIPLIGLILVATRFVPESRTPGRLRLDLISALLSVVGIVSLVYALKSLFYAGLWYPDVLGSIALGALALTVFARRQLRLPNPLIDLRLLRVRAFSASVAAKTISVFTMSAFGLILSQYFQLVQGWTPLEAGLAFVPSALAALVVGGLAPTVVEWIGRARAVASGLGLAALGFAILAGLEAHSTFCFVAIAQVAFGIGASLTLTVTGDTILGTVPRSRAGAASAVSATAYEIGGSLGIAVMGSLLSTTYRSELVLPAGVPPEVADPIEESFTATAAVVAGLPEPFATVVRGAAEEAYVGGIRMTMIFSAVVMTLLALAALPVLRGIPKVIEQEAVPDQTTSSGV